MEKASRFVDFRAVRAAVGMEQVLGRYGLADKLARDGDSLAGPCPIRKGDDPPRFRADLGRNSWGCESDCRCGGSALDFVARMEGVELPKAARLIAEWFGLDLGKQGADENVPSDSPPGRAMCSPAPRPARPGAAGNRPLGFRLELDPSHPYLAGRGLSPETVAEFGLGHCARGLMAGRIAIPIHGSGGELVGYAGRWPGEPPEGQPAYLLPNGFDASTEVFGLRQAASEPAGLPLVLVRGFFDAMALWQRGHRKVAALMGPSMSEAQAALVARHTRADSTVVVVADGSEDGRSGAGEAVRLLAPMMFVRLCALPDGRRAESLTGDELDGLWLRGMH